jgi:hypothetical protein
VQLCPLAALLPLLARTRSGAVWLLIVVSSATAVVVVIDRLHARLGSRDAGASADTEPRAPGRVPVERATRLGAPTLELRPEFVLQLRTMSFDARAQRAQENVTSRSTGSRRRADSA